MKSRFGHSRVPEKIVILYERVGEKTCGILRAFPCPRKYHSCDVPAFSITKHSTAGPVSKHKNDGTSGL